MYVEILCPRCLAAVSSRRPSDVTPRVCTPAPQLKLSLELEENEDSLTETDIVEAQVVSDEGRRDD